MFNSWWPTLVLYGRLLFFWLFLFMVERIICVFYFIHKIPQRSVSSIFTLLFHSLRLDLSTAAYLVTIPLLVIVCFQLFSLPINIKPFIARYQTILIGLVVLLEFVNLNLYREWGTKISYKAVLTFVKFPYEAAISSFTTAYIAPLLIYVLFAYAAIQFSRQWLAPVSFSFSPVSKAKKIVQTIFLLGVHLLFIRGGWQLSPINESMSHYSNYPVYNQLATNTIWQMMNNALFELKPQKSQYVYFSQEQAYRIVESNRVTDTSYYVLKDDIKNPNVVFIILESFTADLVESLGGEPGVAPTIEKMIKNGILFKNIYASGDRTDKGVISLLSSFPAQATRSIIKENSKQIHLPCIAQNFKQHQYATSFYYGGESEFFGLKSYLLAHDYERIVDKNSFQASDCNSKWGAHDDIVLRKQLNDLKTMPTPFFSTILTLSNHEPFEIPIPGKFKGGGVAVQFKNTAYYTDYSLGNYLKEAQKQPWFASTLFVLVADHGHRLPRDQYEIWNSKRYRIPFILFGDVIREQYRGTTIDVIGSQTDIAETLLAQLHIKRDPFIWSRSLLRTNQQNGYAFFNWDNGFGLVGPSYELSYDEDTKRVIEFKSLDKRINLKKELNFSKAYMQKIYSAYLQY
jgi:phosphoglycerol transferase MdoB-like AlkP superfamily enzyme